MTLARWSGFAISVWHHQRQTASSARMMSWFILKSPFLVTWQKTYQSNTIKNLGQQWTVLRCLCIHWLKLEPQPHRAPWSPSFGGSPKLTTSCLVKSTSRFNNVDSFFQEPIEKKSWCVIQSHRQTLEQAEQSTNIRNKLEMWGQKRDIGM